MSIICDIKIVSYEVAVDNYAAMRRRRLLSYRYRAFVTPLIVVAIRARRRLPCHDIHYIVIDEVASSPRLRCRELRCRCASHLCCYAIDLLLFSGDNDTCFCRHTYRLSYACHLFTPYADYQPIFTPYALPLLSDVGKLALRRVLISLLLYRHWLLLILPRIR